MSMTLEQAVKHWSLQLDGKVIETDGAHVYPVLKDKQQCMLKFPKEGFQEARAASVLQYFDGKGAIRLIDHLGPILLMERAGNRRKLKNILIDNEPEAVGIVVNVVKELHAPRDTQSKPDLIDLKAHFKALFERAKSDMTSNPKSVFIAAAKKAIHLIEQQKDLIVLHGDVHYDNVVYSNDENWLTIDPKGLIGEATYDFANLVCNPFDIPEISQNRKRVYMITHAISKEYGLNDDLLLEWVFVHGALAACWSKEDPAHWLTMSYLASTYAIKDDMRHTYNQTADDMQIDLNLERFT